MMTKSSVSSSFVPKEFWNFPPSFTIQPITNTKEKQLKLWRELILDYCMSNNTFSIVPASFPYFRNSAINRQLSSEAIDTIVSYVISCGNGEWEDISSKLTLRVLWKSPDMLAQEIYSWACHSEIIGTVYTIYELHSGDENTDSGFHGTDPVLIRRALDILEASNKCKILRGDSPDEDGVKFIAIT